MYRWRVRHKANTHKHTRYDAYKVRQVYKNADTATEKYAAAKCAFLHDTAHVGHILANASAQALLATKQVKKKKKSKKKKECLRQEQNKLQQG